MEGDATWTLLLSLVKEVEVLAEMAADKWSDSPEKWNAIAGIEAVK